MSAGPPHLALEKKRGALWTKLGFAGAVVLSVVGVGAFMATSVFSHRNARPRLVSPPPPNSKHTTPATAQIVNPSFERPMIADVNGDGTDDVIATFSAPDETQVVAIDGKNFTNRLWTSGPLPTRFLGRSVPLQTVLTRDYVAVLDALDQLHVVRIATGEHAVLMELRGGAQHLWHPASAGENMVYLEASDGIPHSVDLNLGVVIDDHTRPTCKDDLPDCITHDAVRARPLSDFATIASIRIPRKNAEISPQDHAWRAGDFFVARSRQGHGQLGEVAVGGKLEGNSIEWIETTDSISPSTTTPSAFDIDPEWTVDETNALSIVLSSGYGSARLDARSMRTGALVWTMPINGPHADRENIGPILAKHGRVYASLRDEIDVFESASGARLGSVQSAILDVSK